MKKNRNALSAPTKQIRKGVYIYKVNSSPYWRVRVWIPSEGRYRVRSTKEATRIEAAKAADEFAAKLQGHGELAAVPKSRSFETFADRLMQRQKAQVKQEQLHKGTEQGDVYTIRNNEWGLIAFFGRRDISSIRPKDVSAYVTWMQKEREEPLAASTINRRISCLRKILKLAQEEDVIGEMPAVARAPRDDRPRPYFRFEPLVSNSEDALSAVLKGADFLAEAGEVVRGVKVTYELKDFIRFMLVSFLRPTLSEIYALRNRDITVASNPDRLLLTLKKGKTGHRTVVTLPSGVLLYQRQMKRYPDAKADDFFFLPMYRNRSTALRIFQRQFKRVLVNRVLENDEVSGDGHSLYSLRHTAICMRLVTSDAQVNIFTLAKNAGTSVEQIERFYARFLPLSPELVKNLHSQGEWQVQVQREAEESAAKADAQRKKLGVEKIYLEPGGPI